jgi:hypothetical protein
MSAANWLHLAVHLQIPGCIVAWLFARSVYRKQERP